MCLQSYLSDYRLPLTCSQKLLSLLRNIGGIKAFALLTTDGVLKRIDSQVCSIVADAVRTDLFKAGFVTNEDKSVWIPCQRLDWLGITWDSARGTIEIVDRRVAKITSTIDSIIDSDFVLSARRLASFTGQIISTAPVSGNISRLGTALCLH